MGRISIEELDQSLIEKINSGVDNAELERMNEEILANKTSILDLQNRLGKQIYRVKTILTNLSSKVE